MKTIEKKLLIITISILLSACGGSSNDSTSHTPPDDETYDINDLNNYITAYKFKERYNTFAEDCGDSSKPAYQCSGVVIRGIRIAAQPKPWVHRDKDKNKGVISFAYIRNDTNFKLPTDVYQSGIIINSNFEEKTAIRCASPLDFNTDARSGSEFNCGKSNEKQLTSTDFTIKDCQDWGINTADKWLSTFIPVLRETKRITGDLGQAPGQLCSFTMTNTNDDKFKNRADYFKLYADIRNGIPNDLKPTWWNNEIVVDAWNDAKATNAPIEAFYYNFGDKKGLRDAQSFQNNYYADTQTILPIIAIDFEGNKDGTSNFYFSVHDQTALKQFKNNQEKIAQLVPLLIGAPPTSESDLLQDFNIYNKNLDTEIKNPSRWNLAIQDANYSGAYLLNRFTQGNNSDLGNTNTISLVDYVINLEQPAVNGLKSLYMKSRPFMHFQTNTCTPALDSELKLNGSYPSGHSVRGYLVSAALSDVNKTKEDSLLAVANDYADSRIICRAHWESDTVAAQKVTTIIMNMLRYDNDYQNIVKSLKQ